MQILSLFIYLFLIIYVTATIPERPKRLTRMPSRFIEQGDKPNHPPKDLLDGFRIERAPRSIPVYTGPISKPDHILDGARVHKRRRSDTLLELPQLQV